VACQVLRLKPGTPWPAAAATALLFAALAEVGSGAGRGDSAYGVVIGLLLAAALILWFRGIRARPKQPNWLAKGAMWWLVLSFAIGAGIDWLALGLTPGSPSSAFLPLDKLMRACQREGSVIMLLQNVILALGLARLAAGTKPYRSVLIAFWIGISCTVFALGAKDVQETEELGLTSRQKQLVISYFKEQGLLGLKDLTAYWPGAEWPLIWKGLGVNSYLERYQLAGILFNRDKALEGLRRWRIVLPFEVQAVREKHLDELPFWLGILKPCLQIAPPSPDDLCRLCADRLDYAVLPIRFEGFAPAGGEGAYIYPCHKVQDACRERGWEPQPAAAEMPGSAGRLPRDYDILGCGEAGAMAHEGRTGE
jgi:hypothetical protein